MGPIVICPNGHVFESVVMKAFAGASGAKIVLRNNQEPCPTCGALSRSPDGTIRFGTRVWEALNAPGVTLETIEHLKSLAAAVMEGSKSSASAAREIEQQNAAFATILQWSNGNAQILAVLIALVALFIQCYSVWDSTRSDAVAHADAQRIEQAIVSQTQAVEKQTEVLQSAEAARANLAEAQQQIDFEIARLNALYQQQQKALLPSPPMQATSQRQMPAAGAPLNRHERRKAARLTKRKR